MVAIYGLPAVVGRVIVVGHVKLDCDIVCQIGRVGWINYGYRSGVRWERLSTSEDGKVVIEQLIGFIQIYDVHNCVVC